MSRSRVGATEAERTGPVVGDDIVSDARLVATRCIDIAAPPHEVFPWLRQMGFGRAGWYSWDVLDNLGRRSATGIQPEWQHLEAGDIIPGGPVTFFAAVVEPPRAFVIMLDDADRIVRRVPFSLAYELRDAEVNEAPGTRIVTRVRARVSIPGGRLVERIVLGPGDGIMVRRQLRNIARRVQAGAPG